MTDAIEPKPKTRGPGVRVGPDGLTDKERLYIAEIQIDWNGTQAAIRAGYSPKSASDIASELNRKPHIVDAIVASMAKRAEKAQIDAQWVLIRLVATERQIAARGKKANPLHRLRALELIGKHVDVNAFRTQFGVGNPDGTPIDAGGWDFAALDDEEFETLGRLLRKCRRSPDGAGNGPPAALALGAGGGAEEDRAGP